VGDSVTTYTNGVLHHNLGAAFFFDGKHHRVSHSASIINPKISRPEVTLWWSSPEMFG
jgi:hypothetical protein